MIRESPSQVILAFLLVAKTCLSEKVCTRLLKLTGEKIIPLDFGANTYFLRVSHSVTLPAFCPVLLMVRMSKAWGTILFNPLFYLACHLILFRLRTAYTLPKCISNFTTSCEYNRRHVAFTAYLSKSMHLVAKRKWKKAR